MNEASSEESNIPDWPVDWPGRYLVELDNVGDPSFWIKEQIPDPASILLGDPTEDENYADAMTEAYIARLDDLGFSLPTEFDVGEEEMRKAFTKEFLGFLREWRKKALAKGAAIGKDRQKNHPL